MSNPARGSAESERWGERGSLAEIGANPPRVAPVGGKD